jgi:hypothetical protein
MTKVASMTDGPSRVSHTRANKGDVAALAKEPIEHPQIIGH